MCEREKDAKLGPRATTRGTLRLFEERAGADRHDEAQDLCQHGCPPEAACLLAELPKGFQRACQHAVPPGARCAEDRRAPFCPTTTSTTSASSADPDARAEDGARRRRTLQPRGRRRRAGVSQAPSAAAWRRLNTCANATELVIIGGFGGSATRFVHTLLRQAGYAGRDKINGAHDALLCST